MQAFDQASPVADWRSDFNAASIVTAIYRAAGARAVKIADCMPPWKFGNEPDKEVAQKTSALGAFKSFLLSKVGKNER
ncbi:DUF4035 domain-containing protein [Paraburkholderia bannensis]|uniref:phage tail assembly protein T n=1 Tax=Paraburkholderia TaxID=1822464 RepID=UPI0039058B92